MERPKEIEELLAELEAKYADKVPESDADSKMVLSLPETEENYEFTGHEACLLFKSKVTVERLFEALLFPEAVVELSSLELDVGLLEWAEQYATITEN